MRCPTETAKQEARLLQNMVRMGGRVFQEGQSSRLGPGSAGQCSADSGGLHGRGCVNWARKGPEAQEGPGRPTPPHPQELPVLRSLSGEAERRQFGGAEAVRMKDSMGVGTASARGGSCCPRTGTLCLPVAALSPEPRTPLHRTSGRNRSHGPAPALSHWAAAARGCRGGPEGVGKAGSGH